MKEKRILRILGQVDEKYIEEAAPWKRVVGDSSMFPSFRFKRIRHTALIAAILTKHIL